MKPRLVLGLILLASVACSGDKEPNTGCLSINRDYATFALATPLSGRDFMISVGEEGGVLDSLDCQPANGSVSCTPEAARLSPTFDANGALQSVTLHSPIEGTLNVQIVVDGAPAASGSFQYHRTTSIGPCGPTVDPVTFTIAD
jgi:hypothetical protein